MAIKPPTSKHKKRAPFVARWLVWIYFPMLLLTGLVLLALWKSGKGLTGDDVFEHVPWAVVISGEGPAAERSEQLLRWQKEGRIDSAVVSGTRHYKTYSTSEWARQYLEEGGFPRIALFEFQNESSSSLEESRQLMRQFRLFGWDTVLIVTSNYDVRRARYVFQKLAGGHPTLLVASADDPAFNPRSWWASRESRSKWAGAWLALLTAYWDGIGMGADRIVARATALSPDIWSGRPGFQFPTKEDTSALPMLDTLSSGQKAVDSSRQALDSLSKVSDSVPVGAGGLYGSNSVLPEEDTAAASSPLDVKPAEEVVSKAEKTVSAKPVEASKTKSINTEAAEGKSLSKTAKKVDAKAEAKSSSKTEVVKPANKSTKSKSTDKKPVKPTTKKKVTADR